MPLLSPIYKIAIVGAGTTGLALAGFLKAAGHAVDLFERFDAPRPLGAGLLLQPTGLAVLARLGLDEKLIALSSPVHRLYGETQRGTVIYKLDYRWLAPHLFGLGTHRASLFQVLYNHVQGLNVPIHTGCDAIKTRTHADGKLSLHMADGRDAGPFDLIVDASGRQSKLALRHGAVSHDTPYPYAALWGVVHDLEGFSTDQLLQRYDAARVMIGTLPLGQTPTDPRPHMAFFWSLPARDHAVVRAAGLSAWQDGVARYWPLMRPFAEQFTAFDQLTFAEYGHRVMKRWHAGRLIFTGDAAHPISPQLGQGANLGLCDALILSEALSREPGIDEAIATYSRARKAHLTFYQIASRWMTPFFQSDQKLAPWVRDRSFGLMCRMPWMREEMLRTLAGVKTGLFRHLDPGHWHPRYRLKP
ncbi:NAD(P)/FAD-dependent oxidoreductase [Asticcacaulis sp. YBE204]|uniref:FAD-dependent oxidoreductase n=1 Tax=Asticcacaulis sp. YBE204 TaxID=1282363 RepID=UPI0003C3B1F8|nr:NAD(P)/FAD-dependent oxidoreductase [Asticcacaulis sp. YBE204]ESQ80630.1 hypothetical protein AEYBE204_04995 [Asticcacaulis sp. YBE204]